MASAPVKSTADGLRPTVGLEVHARLSARTKLFCACANRYGELANSQTCPVCLGLPGSLPVLQAEAVALALRAGLALGGDIRRVSRFARKNYFYPDLPRNYQITQYDEPFCLGGDLTAADRDGTPVRVRLERIHLEEDAGRSLRRSGQALVDLNRAGTPLIEIVTRPDLGSGDEARLWLRVLRRLLRHLRVCDGNLQEGSFRCDANVGFAPPAESPGGGTNPPLVELKNLNSFRAVGRAVDCEIERLGGLLAAGGVPRRETRSWDEAAGCTRFLRAKEAAADYRYFPEPDLPRLVLDEAVIARIRRDLPENPAARLARWKQEFALAAEQSEALCETPERAAYFEEVVAGLSGAGVPVGPEESARLAASFILGEVPAEAGGRDCFAVSVEHLVELLALLASGGISSRSARQVYVLLPESGESPREIVARLDLGLITDADVIARLCRRVVAEHPAEVGAFGAGKSGLFEFFVGRVLAAADGRAEPGQVRRELAVLLREGD